jgi:hypothetical protein
MLRDEVDASRPASARRVEVTKTRPDGSTYTATAASASPTQREEI